MQNEINCLKEEMHGLRTLLNARTEEIKEIKYENTRLAKDYDFCSEENAGLQKQVSKLKYTIKNIAELI